MKGLAVLAVLFVAIAGALWLVVRPSDRDLEIHEERIAEALDEADAHLTEATRELNALRSIKPNILVLDRDLEAFRAESRQLRAVLGEHRTTRPDPGAPRDPAVDARKETEEKAGALRQRSADLVVRAGLVAEFMRETQPKVQRMRARFGELFRLRRQLETAGDLDDAMRVKLDSLQAEVNKKQALAKSVFDAGSRDAEQGRILLGTVSAEVDQVLGEIDALLALLTAG